MYTQYLSDDSLIFTSLFLVFLLRSSRYHVPRSWLKPTNNLLVLFEELGGDASKISLLRRSVTGICGEAVEHHVKNESYIIESSGESDSLHLQCNPGQIISAIKFASFGTPLGTCGSYQKGTCHAPDSHAILEKVLSNLLSYRILFYTSFSVILRLNTGI